MENIVYKTLNKEVIILIIGPFWLLLVSFLYLEDHNSKVKSIMQDISSVWYGCSKPTWDFSSTSFTAIKL